MQLARVIGHATATIKHPTLSGQRLVVVQPLDARERADGEPVLSLDFLGSGLGDRVIITSDGAAVREIIGDNTSPARWAVLGLADQ